MIDGRGKCRIIKGQGQIVGAVRGQAQAQNLMGQVKILTTVAGGSTGNYVVSLTPLPTCPSDLWH